MKLQQTAKFKGKIFALECKCKERGGYQFFERTRTFGGLFKGHEYVHDVPVCPVCDFTPWIILPQDGK